VAAFGAGDGTAIDGSVTDATAARPSNTIWSRLKAALGQSQRGFLAR